MRNTLATVYSSLGSAGSKTAVECNMRGGDTSSATRLTRAHEHEHEHGHTLSGRVFAPKSLRGSLNLRFSVPTWSLIVIRTSGDMATVEAMMA